MIKKILMLSMLAVLTACGVKPGHVHAPEGAENNGFPHQYPSLRTDPTPVPETNDTGSR